jgi:hypothetical protein
LLSPRHRKPSYRLISSISNTIVCGFCRRSSAARDFLLADFSRGPGAASSPDALTSLGMCQSMVEPDYEDFGICRLGCSADDVGQACRTGNFFVRNSEACIQFGVRVSKKALTKSFLPRESPEACSGFWQMMHGLGVLIRPFPFSIFASMILWLINAPAGSSLSIELPPTTCRLCPPFRPFRPTPAPRRPREASPFMLCDLAFAGKSMMLLSQIRA